MKKLTALLALLLALLPLSAAQEQHGKGYIPLTPERRKDLQAVSRAAHGARIAMLGKFQTLPTAFDCREKGWVPPTWDQGNCGSCYLVSSVRVFTCSLLKAGYGKPDNSFMMSAQYGMDRPRNFGGCNGGNGTEVADWAIRNGWIAERYVELNGTVHNDYPPYEARSGSDRTKAGAKVWLKDGATWGFANDNGRPTALDIKIAMYNYGTLSVALDAGGQFGSGTGTITALGSNIDHEICLSAWDDTDSTFMFNNQWGESWGNGGYRKVKQDVVVSRCVDIFFVSAVPLPPPPPPPPDPPGPGPGPVPVGGISVVIGSDVKAGKYLLYPEGTPVVTPEQQVLEKAMQDLLNKKYPPKAEPPPEKKIEPIPVPETKEPPKIEEKPQPKKSAKLLDYGMAREYAIWHRKPLFVGVGCDPPVGENFVSARVEAPFNGWHNETVIFAMYNAYDLEATWWMEQATGKVHQIEKKETMPEKWNPYRTYRDPTTGKVIERPVK